MIKEKKESDSEVKTLRKNNELKSKIHQLEYDQINNENNLENDQICSKWE